MNQFPDFENSSDDSYLAINAGEGISFPSGVEYSDTHLKPWYDKFRSYLKIADFRNGWKIFEN